MTHLKRHLIILLLIIIFLCCTREQLPEADLILKNGNVYTLTWPDPSTDGTPHEDAPFTTGGWQPDAETIVVKNGLILYVGSDPEADQYIGKNTHILDVQGAYVLPGLVDSHTHVLGLGRNLDRINLTGARNEEEAIELVAEHAKNVPPGEWIIAWGWDEGAWADHYPDKQLLTEKVPDHPVIMNSLHGFAVWCNDMALERAGITKDIPSPAGGEIVKDEKGNPTGLFLNNATNLLQDAIPAPDHDKIKSWLMAGLNEMARSGYVAVHDAGVGTDLMNVMKELDTDDGLPIRVYAMISSSDEPLMSEWLDSGPLSSETEMFYVRSVKAFYDGALGSRGARLLDDYSDMPGHRGVSGSDYGFNQDLVSDMINAGFQVNIHAIGDAGNRETLDFLENEISNHPDAINLRHRIEHAQVVHPDDFTRFGELKIIASMQPPHCAEDMAWAGERLGPERIKGAYAWRTLRKAGAGLIFNSDLAGSDHNIFYGLHSAITRRNKDLKPREGWYPEESVTPEEALRAYTIWPAFASFLENKTGTLETGKWADITVIDLDPLEVGRTQPEKLFSGTILYTIVDGKILYQNSSGL